MLFETEHFPPLVKSKIQVNYNQRTRVHKPKERSINDKTSICWLCLGINKASSIIHIDVIEQSCVL